MNYIVQRKIERSSEIKIGDFVKSETHKKGGVKVTEILEDGDFVTDEVDFWEHDSYYVLPKGKAIKLSKDLWLFDGINPIGKVSHGAIWLREGNEIHKDDVQKICKVEILEDDYWDNESLNKVKIEEVIKDMADYRKDVESYEILSRTKHKEGPEEVEVLFKLNTYMIKGPCGHFH